MRRSAISRDAHFMTAAANPATRATMTATMHPQHSPPIFRCLPDRVDGILIARLMRDFAAEVPLCYRSSFSSLSCRR